MSIQEQSNYGVREFDLSTARTNKRIDLRADNFAVLRADDDADIRVNSPDNSAIPVRDISGLTIAESGSGTGIERIYISNTSGTGVLRLLTGFGVASGSTSTPSGDTTDVSDRSARELGKARVEDSGGVLIDPAERQQLANQSSVTAFSVSTGGALPSNTVPDNVDVTVLADPDNDANTDVNTDFPLTPGSAISLRVTNTDLITVGFNGTGTDSVSVIYEG